jgi:16S rRNA (guanine966-N2)-methyltransferase
MRIIAGTLGGRQFDSPKSPKTHPMSDKARGALFNVLGDIGELTVLDAFSGSGAIAFEAASRGAAEVLAIDNDRTAQKTITQNIRDLQLQDVVKLIAASASAWLDTSQHTTFDIIVCDPPYNDLQPSLLARLADRLTPAGVLIVSWPGNTDAPAFAGLRLLDQKKYGDMMLLFYGPHA